VCRVNSDKYFSLQEEYIQVATYDNVYKVKLRSQLEPNQRVVFYATPNLTESRSVNYTALDPIHAPGQIMIYKNTSSRTFSIDANLVSRNAQEGANNLYILQMLRSWCMPVFGIGKITSQGTSSGGAVSENVGTSDEILGAPPKILLLSAYSNVPSADEASSSNTSASLEHIRRVPVVITSLSIPYNNDVDYIPVKDSTMITSTVPMPVFMNISISLTETHSGREYEKFDLKQFKLGILKGF
jgi:hypothetical protein